MRTRVSVSGSGTARQPSQHRWTGRSWPSPPCFAVGRDYRRRTIHTAAVKPLSSRVHTSTLCLEVTGQGVAVAAARQHPGGRHRASVPMTAAKKNLFITLILETSGEIVHSLHVVVRAANVSFVVGEAVVACSGQWQRRGSDDRVCWRLGQLNYTA